jgi:hypothetical protein
MAIYEEVPRIIRGKDEETGEALTELVVGWVRWNDDCSRGERLPDSEVPGLVKAVAEHCKVRKVRHEDGEFSPMFEDVNDWKPPPPRLPPEPMSVEGQFLTNCILGGGAIALGVAALVALSDDDAPEDKPRRRVERKAEAQADEPEKAPDSPVYDNT